MDKRIKVLMVDDEAQFRITTDKLLTRRGFDTIMADSGQAALDKMTENPDVVVLDIKMPGMDGHETLRRIKKTHPDIPVIMLTGHGEISSAEQAHHEGALDYLSKPCDINVLTEKIREAYNRGQAQTEEKEKTVLDIMIPAEEYTLLNGNCTVREAIVELKASFGARLSTTSIMETGHRSVLVVDDKGQAQGFLAITDLLSMVLPDYLSAPKPSLADTIQYSPIFWEGMFASEIRRKADTPISDIMSPVPFFIRGDASLMEAAYKMIIHKVRRLVVTVDDSVVGLVREQDLFFEMARILTDQSK